MTTSQDTDNFNSSNFEPVMYDRLEVDPMDELPDDVEMSIFDHLEELRRRIFYSLIVLAVFTVGCFLGVKQIVRILEIPAKGVKFVQVAPGEYFFLSFRVAIYSGLILASPFILYQVMQFVLPGLTRRERRLLAPIVFGSSLLFLGGLAFGYLVIVPAALVFFINYGADVVEQLWSLERYFDFVLGGLFGTGIVFQIPVIQLLLGQLGIVSSAKMLAGWRYVILGALIAGAIITPSTDPVTQSLLAGAILGLYFGGVGLVKFIGK
jgi:sec-independent protein translocase protein TatC